MKGGDRERFLEDLSEHKEQCQTDQGPVPRCQLLSLAEEETQAVE